jgi:hypothetical protein
MRDLATKKKAAISAAYDYGSERVYRMFLNARRS